ncbi:MAG: LysM peptidoglycan-binding domain-containing protein [Deltaproteobacteria bacterium]|nr:LysM peptidoglycan-binding domain-containing protein [Deltaproteobacteria bacterium]
MNRRIVIPLTSLVLFLFICFSDIFSQEVSDTKTIAFTKNVVVKKYKMGDVQAEPYTVKRDDNLWVILVKNYGVKNRQFYFFCRITKSLNPKLRNADEIVPGQVLLIPFKYVPHFEVEKEGFRSVLLDVLSSQSSEMQTEEYTFSKGEHMAQVLRDMYNVPDDLIFNKYLEMVGQLNPDIDDIDLVKPEQKIILPSITSYLEDSGEEVKPEEVLAKESVTEEIVEEAEAEEVAAQEEVAEEAQTEVPVQEEIVVEKKVEPVYIDPRFRKIAKRIPASKTLSMHYMNSIADLLQGNLARSDELNIPLMQEGQININTNNFPILQLTDRKKIILNYGGKLSSGLIELIESELDDLEVVNLREGENIGSVLDKVINTAGYFSVDKGQNPLVIGDKVQFEIMGDWIIYKDELFEDIMVLNLMEKGSKPVDSQLKDYISNFGVNLVDLYMMGDGEQEKDISPPKKAEDTYPPEDIPVIDTSDSVVLVDSLLVLLGQELKKDYKIKLFQGTYDGFNIEVTADRYFERRGVGHLISFHNIPEKLTEVIIQQGNRFLNLSSLEDSSAVIKSILEFLYISYDAPRPRFTATSEAEKKVEIVIPGILIKKDKKTTILLTSRKH